MKKFALYAAFCWAILCCGCVGLAQEPQKPSPVSWEATLDDVGQVLSVKPVVDGKYRMLREAISPTEYKIFVSVVKKGTDYPDVYMTTVKIGGSPSPDPQPDPKPNPKPDPKPDPAPNKPVVVYVITETSTYTPELAKVLDSKPWRDVLAGASIPFRVMDKDISKAAFPVATDKAVAKGLPAVVFIDKAGTAVVESVPVGKPEAMAELVKVKVGVR